MLDIVAGSVRAGCPQRIAKVFDQYLSFTALESRLFSLGLPDTYLLLNDPKAQDAQVQVGRQLEPDSERKMTCKLLII